MNRNRPGGPRFHRQAGVVLATTLLLLFAVTTIAVSAMATVAQELWMASNQHAQVVALQAAEAGIEQALDSTVLAIDGAALDTKYDSPNGPNPVPRRGNGTRIAGCEDPALRADQRCEYFLRFAATTALPGAPGDPDLRAYHFVVDSFGVGSRGAEVTLQAGFYVVAPLGGAGPLCPPADAACTNPYLGRPVRSFWRQRGAD